VGAALADRPRMLAHGTLNGWARRLWSWNEPGSYLGTNGGGGIGYGPGASIGAALAARGDGRIIVNLQPDGDLLFTPSALWTMTRESLPILNVVWNNRSYYNSQEHAVRIAKQRGRSLEETHLGMRLDEPAVDFATLGRSFGLYAEGPITEPGDLRPALDRAVRAVLDGGPALVDVVARAR
jgi:thiamine pyrophosphate-dependent acetolactate synthase large subunit-like protein